MSSKKKDVTIIHPQQKTNVPIQYIFFSLQFYATAGTGV